MRCAGAGISTLGVKSRGFGGGKKQTAKRTEWNFSPSRFSFAKHLAIREAAPPARPREDPAILLPMDPLCRPISVSQPRLATLRVTPPRSRNTTPADLQQSDSETKARGAHQRRRRRGRRWGRWPPSAASCKVGSGELAQRRSKVKKYEPLK